MKGLVGVALGLVLGSLAATALGQTQPWQRGEYPSPNVQREAIPQEAAPPQQPVFQRREAAAPPAGPQPQQPPPPPFQLTPQQEAEVDRVLQIWEQRSGRVKTFECRFTRFEYDGVFGDPNEPRFEDPGELHYTAPDKGAFKVTGERPERWICDGKSIFQYDYQKKQVIEHKLPPEMQGAAIADGPIPFLFGAKAEKLKQRYYLRLITPEEKARTEIWIQAYPRHLQEKQNFDHAEVILSRETMLPTAIQLHQANGKSRTVYAFHSPRVNPIDPLKHLDPLRLFNTDPFYPTLPGHDWTRVVERPPTEQAGGYPPQLPRR